MADLALPTPATSLVKVIHSCHSGSQTIPLPLPPNNSLMNHLFPITLTLFLKKLSVGSCRRWNSFGLGINCLCACQRGTFRDKIVRGLGGNCLSESCPITVHSSDPVTENQRVTL